MPIALSVEYASKLQDTDSARHSFTLNADPGHGLKLPSYILKHYGVLGCAIRHAAHNVATAFTEHPMQLTFLEACNMLKAHLKSKGVKITKIEVRSITSIARAISKHEFKEIPSNGNNPQP